MRNLCKQIVVGILAAAVIGVVLAPVQAAPQAGGSAVSANIPLDSYIYDDLSKLDGMGYIIEMRIGRKPYTRLQAAKWTAEALRSGQKKPAYIEAMLARLRNEFAAELAYLAGRGIDSEMGLKEWKIDAGYYDGDSIANIRSKSFYQPLNINHNGYSLGERENFVASMRIEKSLDEHLVLSVTPRFDAMRGDNEGTFSSAYLKTRFHTVEIAAGKDPLWWGQGLRGTLALSNNADPMTYLKLTNMEPMHLNWFNGLGDIHASVFYAELSDMGMYDGSTLHNPGFVGMRADFVPTDRFTFGIARTSVVGHLRGGDLADFLLGTNADDADTDQWNSIGGIDFRWRLPHRSNAQLYGEIYGEDQSHELGFIPVPSKKAYVAGLYLPKLTADGRWEATLEYGKTSRVWYSHWAFSDGYVNGGNIIGDAMGNDAQRYYIKLTRFMDGKNQLSLHLERLESHENPWEDRTLNTVWISGKSMLEDSFWLEGFAGMSAISGPEDRRNYLAGFSLTKYY